MTPVSLTWGTIDDESRSESDPFGPPSHTGPASHAEPAGPFALADLLTDIVARYAPRPQREQPVTVSWLTLHSGTVSMPVMQR